MRIGEGPIGCGIEKDLAVLLSVVKYRLCVIMNKGEGGDSLSIKEVYKILLLLFWTSRFMKVATGNISFDI